MKLIAAFLLVIFFISGSLANCGNSTTTCSECISMDGCGWCNNPSKCELIADNSDCLLWWGSTCDNPDTCADAGDCATCTLTTQCGWCDNEICLDINATESRMCQSFIIYDSVPACSNPALRCPSYRNCESCTNRTAETSCIWCEQLVDGIAQFSCKAYTEESSCYNSWQGECIIDPPVVCETYEDCMSCTEEPSAECGWCQSTRKCMNIAHKNNCTNFFEDTCEGTCREFDADCETCLSVPLCGWCDDRCVEGNTTSAYYASCVYYSKHNCTVPCDNYTFCEECILEPGCGWCEISGENLGSCNRIPPNGKTDTICAAGEWYGNQMCPMLSLYCVQATDCNSCIEQPNCAWCGSVGVGCQYVPAFSANPSFPQCVNYCGLTPGPPSSQNWVIYVAVGGASTFAVVAGIVAILFYKYYWKKRHYYEVLK